MTRLTLAAACVLLVAGAPALAQSGFPGVPVTELTGNYDEVMHEDYIERGPGSFLGDFTGMPLSDEGRAKALLYTSNLPDTHERQCLAQSAGIFQYRPVTLRIWKELDNEGDVVAWVIAGDNLRGDIRIYMDGRPHPSSNAQHLEGSFATGQWEGDTLRVRMTHLKTAWIRRGVGIPASDHSTITLFISRRDDVLTLTTIQEDPYYLTEPHVVSRIFTFDPDSRGVAPRPVCNTANLLSVLEDTGEVPHYLPGQNPEEDYMVRTYNLPMEAAMGYAHTLYPEYRRTIRDSYEPPASCDQYCCGWIERQGFPGGAPNLECRDGGSELFERFRR